MNLEKDRRKSITSSSDNSYSKQTIPRKRIKHHDGNSTVITPPRFRLIISFRRYVIIKRPSRELHQPKPIN